MADAPPIVNGRVYRHLKDKSSFDWVVNHHRANLVRSVSNQTPLEFWNREFFSQDQEAGLRGRRGFRIDFAELQRMKLRKLQIKLVRHTVEMAKTGKEPGKPAEEEVVSKPNGNGKTDDTKFEVKNGKGKEKAADARNDNDAKVEIKHEKEEERTADAGDGDGATGWERDLENYVKAVRDYEYMIGFSATKNDPFVASSEHRVDHKILEEEMHHAGVDFTFLAGLLGDGIEKKAVSNKILPTGPWSATNEPIWGKRYLGYMKNIWKDMGMRFGALCLAYGFVLLPAGGIILATLLPNEDSPLAAKLAPFLILVIFVALWGIMMITTVKQVKDVLPMTAGYTAVLGIILNGAAGLRLALYPPAASTPRT